MTSTSHPVGTTSGEAVCLAVVGRFIDALVVREFDALVGTMTDDVTFRALLPSRILSLNGTSAVRATFHHWFGGSERWELVEAVVGDVGGRIHVHWRIRLTNPDVGPGTFIVEQQVYADAAPDGRLRDVALLCSGYRPETS